MPGLGLRMNCQQNQEQRLSLSYKQSQTLKLMVEMKFPWDQYEGVPGFAGMSAAHKLLQKHGESGILIGGIAKDMWTKNSTEEELDSHKDVDVMALSFSFKPGRFEAGIDWWLPCGPKNITYSIGKLSTMSDQAVWWTNGNGVMLNFGLENIYDLPKRLEPGLYIPSESWVAQMWAGERIFKIIDLENEHLLDKMVRWISAKMEGYLPRVSNAIKGASIGILTDIDIPIEGFSASKIAAIKRSD